MCESAKVVELNLFQQSNGYGVKSTVRWPLHNPDKKSLSS